MGSYSRERLRAYRAAKDLGFKINDPMDNDVRKLSPEQGGALACWAEGEQLLNLEGITMQDLLDLYHASIVYDCFSSYVEEEEKAALKCLAVIKRRIRGREATHAARAQGNGQSHTGRRN